MTSAGPVYGASAGKRPYLYALLAVNIGILAAISILFWLHLQGQERVFDKAVRYHGATIEAAQDALAVLHRLSGVTDPRGLARPEDLAAAVSALASQRQAIRSLQQEFADPHFAEAAGSVLRAFDQVLSSASPNNPAAVAATVRSEPFDRLGTELQEFLRLHIAARSQLYQSPSAIGHHLPDYLLPIVALLAALGLTGVVVAVRNRSEQKLAGAVNDLNVAQRLAGVGSWVWDIAENTDSWSDECYRIHGLEPGAKALAGTDYLAYVHPDDRERVRQAHELALAGGEPLDIEFRIAGADGAERIVQTFGEVSCDDAGRPVRMSGTVQDVSELRHRERELRETRERLALAFRLSPAATAITEIETGVHVEVNDKWVEILGHPREEAIGRTAAEMGIWACPEDRKRAVAMLRETGRFRDFQTQFRTRNGDLRDFMVSAEPFPIGGHNHMLIVGYDITEHTAIETELRETAGKLEKSQRAGKIGSWVWDLAGDREWWSDELYRLVGLEVGSRVLGGWEFLEFVHPEDRERIRAAQDRSFREGVPYDVEYRWVRTDGVEIVLSEYGEMEYDADGKPLRMLGTAQDITERKAAEEELRETAKNLAESQRIGKLGSWVWEIAEDREWWSEELYRIVGWNPAVPYQGGREFLKHVHPDDRHRVGDGLDRSLTDNRPYLVEYRFRHADGHEIILSEHAETEYDCAGKPVRMRGTTQDVTELKRIEQELARLNAELEQRVEERTAELRAAQDELVKRERLATLGQLTATVSHELRNPLGAIRTSLYIVEKKTAQKDGDLEETFRRINRSITRCDNIIDELLDYTRIRVLQPEQQDLHEWLSGVLDEQAVPQGVSVIRDFARGRLAARLDSDRLRRAVINVFENACQAMGSDRPGGAPAGSRLSVSTARRPGRVEIAFEDTGPGIAEDALATIFEPLYSTKNFGVGLGLPIVRQIMEQHGGGVEAARGKDGGARFVLWLPPAPGGEAQPDGA